MSDIIEDVFTETKPIPASKLEWAGASDEQLEFMKAVYQANLDRSSQKGKFMGDIPEEELEVIEGKHKAKTAAARACRALLAAARKAIEEARVPVTVGLTSAYRSASHQFHLWQAYFPTYYSDTASQREVMTDGPHGREAVQGLAYYIGARIATPGFSNHQNGVAVDFLNRENGMVLKNSTRKAALEAWKESWFWNWLMANAETYRFYQNTRIDEPWHWEYRQSPEGTEEMESYYECLGRNAAPAAEGRQEESLSPGVLTTLVDLLHRGYLGAETAAEIAKGERNVDRITEMIVRDRYSGSNAVDGEEGFRPGAVWEEIRTKIVQPMFRPRPLWAPSESSTLNTMGYAAKPGAPWNGVVEHNLQRSYGSGIREFMARDYFTEYEPAVRDEHVGKVVAIKGKVRAPLGIKLHRTPNPATKIIDSPVYPQNSDVLIIGLPASFNDQNWYKIRTADHQEGWIESRYIHQIPYKDFDPLIKSYYVVKEGDTLEDLVRAFYPDYNVETGDDLRTIVHAFSILNDTNPAIYYRGESDSWWRDKVFDRDFAATRKIYASIKLRKGGLIYFPTESYIDYLKDTGQVGQRAGWKNHAIDFGKCIYRFINGFIDGCQRIIEGIWEDIKSLFSLSFFKDIYRLIRDIIRDPIAFLESIKEAIGSLYDEVKKLITSSSNQTKFYGVGLGAGMICGTVVQNSISPGAKLISLARLHRLKGISKLIKKVETLDPGSDAYQKAAKRLAQKISNKRLLNIELVSRWGAQNAVKITEAIEKRWNLRKAMGLTDHRQAHHLIPIDSLKSTEVVQKAMVDAGFDINSSVNGIALKQSMHLTAHDYYNSLIKEQVEAWLKKKKGVYTGLEARNYLEKDLIPWAREQFRSLKELREYVD